MKYDFASIEQRWQEYWEARRTFAAPNPADDHFNADKPKFYVLDMFPYPSGVGLHVGHPLGYIATDIVARYRRMLGYNVLHPMGYDAFGLPAEQFAVEHNVHPAVTTERNIANMTRQLRRLGLSYDWDRCFATTDPGYYKWTQWIFLQLYDSWYDAGEKRARPIGELINMLQNEELYVDLNGELVDTPAVGLDVIAGTPIGVRKWHELTGDEQQVILDQHRLAYMDELPVNWCPALGTVLANEEVTVEGRSERGNHPVYKRPLKQWMLRITAYCQRLLEDLDLVDWPEPIKLMQRNWIGRSEGAMVDFVLASTAVVTTGNSDSEAAEAEAAADVIQVFTTRPDTLFGATYMVLAPEHPLVDEITGDEQLAAVRQYQQQARQRPDVDRMAEAKTKTGVFTGAHAINPVNGERIPIWIADYVLMGYGTGAIMAVPAHDERDFEFAKQFSLPIRPVVMPDDAWLENHAVEMEDEPGGSAPCREEQLEKLRQTYLRAPGAFPRPFIGQGVAVNSANDGLDVDNLSTDRVKEKVTQWLEENGLGRAHVQYKLRDWLFSRQRYWGEPFPILHGPDGSIRAVDEADLPVELPPMEDFRPHADENPDAPVQTPLSRAPDSWKHVEIDGVRYTRELNTMPQWAGSCWYYLRFCDARNDEAFVGEEAEQYWMTSKRRDGQHHAGGVDLYVGGAEHAVLHLLYSRFWHKVLYDLGHVSTPEPFGRLFNQGYIQAYAYTDDRGVYVEASEVQEQGNQYFHQGKEVKREFGKMGKSLKNAVTPDEICDQYGCDTMRLYEMYMGPLDQSKVWNTRDIIGVHRFLQRVWRNFVDDETGELRVTDEPAPLAIGRKLHKTIRRVTEAMDTMAFNIAIAALIELNNELVPLSKLPREVARPMVLMLAPLTPHIAEELWHRLGGTQSLSAEPWPAWEDAMLVEETIEYPVQVAGKLRGRITVPADASDAAIEEAALADEAVAAHIAGKTVRKVIVVKGRMVNIVAT